MFSLYRGWFSLSICETKMVDDNEYEERRGTIHR